MRLSTRNFLRTVPNYFRFCEEGYPAGWSLYEAVFTARLPSLSEGYFYLQ
ncbi:hypothetical protein GGP87_003237 [Salinibacter ruber]|nr:hypothetical protein [Salinibacter ruber]